MRDQPSQLSHYPHLCHISYYQPANAPNMFSQLQKIFCDLNVIKIGGEIQNEARIEAENKSSENDSNSNGENTDNEKTELGIENLATFKALSLTRFR